ncbi:hypothetical protein D3C71_1482710 [compost metagenome]
MRVAQHKLNLALQHQCFATLEHVGHQLHRPERRIRFEASQPSRQKSERERMRGRNAQGDRTGLGDLLGITRHPRDASDQFLCHAGEPFTGFGQLGGLRAPVEKLGADPLLQRPNAPAERGLGAVAVLCGARKIPCGSQGHEIFKPDQIHVRFVQCIEAAKRNIGRNIPCGGP